MGQEIKFRTPLVNSSLVPRDARTSPMAVRLKHPTKKNHGQIEIRAGYIEGQQDITSEPNNDQGEHQQKYP